jgi:hypothetical protein
VAEGLIRPDQLRRITEEKDMEKAREALEKKRQADDEHQQLRDAFMAREIHPDVFERVSKVVRAAAERGEREVLALRFSSEYCTDGGRAIKQLRARLARHPHRLRQACPRLLAEGARAARLQAARPDHGFPGGVRATSVCPAGGKTLGGPAEVQPQRTAGRGMARQIYAAVQQETMIKAGRTEQR